MACVRDLLRAAAPAFVLSPYRLSRRVFRSLTRALAKVRICQVRGVTIKVGVASEMEQFRVETYATKEPETLDWLEENLHDGDVFMDVGANIGLYTLYAAKLNPRCRVYAFEPESQNFSRLCWNLTLNGVTNVIPCNFPLSDREAFDVLYVGSLEPGSALHSLGQPSEFRDERAPVALQQGVLSVTLDSLVRKHGLPEPALLKIDVDGIEEKILAGAAEALASSTLRTVLVEVTVGCEASSSWPERLLGRFGFELVRKSDWTAELHGLRSQNHVFSRYHAELGPVR